MGRDGEEYNLIGSTEHVEGRIEDLKRNGFAYINVDVAVLGSDFHAAASPLFEKALLHVLDRTSDPKTNQTLRTIWNDNKSEIEGLGAGSDYVAFQDIAGTSSIDMTFKGEKYPYHSCYDNFQWMSKHGDPGFQYHKLMGQIWALLILELSDRPVLPFDLEAYADAVKGFVEDLDVWSNVKADSPEKGRGGTVFDLEPLHEAADTFIENARQFHEWDREWMQNVYGMGGFESSALAIRRISHNTRMANFETDLLDVDGGVSSTHGIHSLFSGSTYSRVSIAPRT